MSLSITLGLIIVTALVSYQALNNRELQNKLLHHPVSEHGNKEYYRLLSSGFVHGSMNHLFINGFVLYMFGEQIERVFSTWYGAIGPFMFLGLYLSAIIAGNLPSHFRHKNNPRYSAVGASGATSALVLIFCILAPWSWFIYPPVPAIVFAIVYLGYSHYADSTNKADGIGHSAHLYGALWGILFLLMTKPSQFLAFGQQLLQPQGPGWF